MSQQHLPPFPFGGSVPFQPTQHQTNNNNMSATNPAVPTAIPQMQQAAFMQNAQLPGLDMATVLQGITPEQLAYIGQLYQSGIIPLPPAQALPTAQPLATNVQAQPAVQQNGMAESIERQEQDSMAIDKEINDLEDGEVSPQREPEFLHPPPTGPRKRSGSIHMRPGHDNADKRAKRQPSPPRQSQGYDRRRPEPRTDGHTSSPPRSQFRQRKAKQDAAKEFVLAMYRAGYAFDDIASELGDVRVLRVLFTDLGLNAPTEKPQPKQPQSTSVFAKARDKNPSVSATATPEQGSPLNSTIAKPAIKPIAKPVAITKAPASADRSAYLAKLQAAKNKKNEALLASTDPSPVVAPVVSQPPEAQQMPAMSVQSQPIPAQPKKAKIQTELIRQRLEALKGEQARKQEAERLAIAAAAASSSFNATPAAPSVDPSAPQTPLRSTNATPHGSQVPGPIHTTEAQYQPAISIQPTPVPALDFISQFPGLPGLFMTGTPPQISSGSYQPPMPAVTSRPVMAPVQAATDAIPSNPDSILSSDATPSLEAEAEVESAIYETSIPAKTSVASSGQATPKHLFNQSKYDSNDDSVIIHVSDEDESESEFDETEERHEASGAPAPPLKSAVPITKPGPLRNFPAPAVSANTSAPTTPGATTPGGSAYERKLQEINEMHRRIAEMQKQPRKAKAKPLSPTDPATTLAAPTTNATNALPGLVNVANNTLTPVATETAVHPVVQQQMEAKLAQLEEEAETISEQRQAAPQTSLPTIAQQVSGVPGADSTTSSDDEDDDAMDLSSGDELESDEIANDNEPSEAAMDLDSDSASLPIDSICANELGTMSDSSSDSDDSSTDSEDEGSEDDYEPAPAASDDTGVDELPTSADLPSQGEVSTASATGLEAVSMVPTPQTGARLEDVDLAPELQPSRSELAQSNATPEATTKPYYKPYESPLRMFRDYRFHPQFTSDVQGGFKSLTYSNKLDPTEAMCPNELSNGTCQDQSCLHQHFHNAAINDGELLKDLGTRNAPWKTEEEKARWNNGLVEVVKQLRNSNQGTDVNAIAARIAQYRRDFVGTPDQILNLNPAPAPR